MASPTTENQTIVGTLLYELFQAIITTLSGGFYGSEICIAGSYRFNECSNYNDGDCGNSS